MHKTTEEKSLLVAASIIIAFLIFSSSFFLVFIEKGFYGKTFQKYGAYDKLGGNATIQTVSYLIDYLMSDQPDATKATGLYYLFTEKELSHLQDVHAIIGKVRYISIFSVVALVIIFLRLRAKDWLLKDIKNILKYSAIIAGATLALTALFFLNFEWAFTQFHHAFFPQGNWQFPSDALLIILFPQQFFEDFVKRALFHALLITLTLYFLGTTSNLMELFSWRSKKN